MNKLDHESRCRVLHLLCEGNSIRATVRLTGVSKTTILKLIADAGRAFDDYQDKTLRNLTCRRIQVDEIWNFVHCKQANAPNTKSRMEGRGDCWTWTAIDADSKLLVSWYVGGRHGDAAFEFMCDLYHRLANRVQLTSDGHNAYLDAVAGTFGSERVDYAQLVKMYGAAPEGRRRYSPPVLLAAVKRDVFGAPDPEHISTSYAEAHNLTMRTCIRRFTRLTVGFSKKVENHVHAVAMHATYYNFVRIHKTLRVSPAMAAGVTDRLWEISDLVAVLEDWENSQRKAA